MNSFVLIKQVPDQSGKGGINADGTIDRAKAKRMLNPFDRYALDLHSAGHFVVLCVFPLYTPLVEAYSHPALIPRITRS